MNKDLLEKQKVDNWLSQFEHNDKAKALALIDDINFIDQLDYDRYTFNIVKKIIDSSKQFNKVYLIPINSLSTSFEPKSDSAFVFNIKKKLPQNITPFWELSNKLERNSIIFFIDEFIGSGNTFVDNINLIDSKILKRIRSLSSYHKIEIHILSIVAYKEAKKLLKNNFKFIKEFSYEIEGSYFSKNKYKNFFEKYVIKSNCKKAMYGYNREKKETKGIVSNIVFYNNCPNNTPAILWCNQKNKPEALFFGKKVNLRYQVAYYKEKQKYQKVLYHIEKSTERIDLLTVFLKQENYPFVIDCIIFLILRKKMGIEKFQFYANCSKQKLAEILTKCFEYHFIATSRKNGKMTKEGKSIIDQILEIYNIFYNDSAKNTTTNENKGILVYYPNQIKGIKPNVQ